jgi:hypothetical protein
MDSFSCAYAFALTSCQELRILSSPRLKRGQTSSCGDFLQIVLATNHANPPVFEVGTDGENR